jgi:peptide/nickel transport system substrate-binding protein
MNKAFLASAVLAAASLASAQVFQWPENYAPTAPQGGNVNETLFGDFTTFNLVISASANESAVLGMTGGPALTYRDWLGTRTFRNEEGDFNLLFASEIEEVRPEQEFIVTLKEGWTWSDGEPITAEDFMVAREITGDPDVQSNNYSCTVTGDTEEPVVYEQLGDYQFSVTLAEPQVNALQNTADCVGAIPAHIYQPVYEEGGAEGIRALWGIDTPVDQIVSGGPYMITEFRPGERIVLTKNPMFGENVKAADGSPLPGPDTWTVTFAADNNAQVALVTTGQADFFWPSGLNDTQAIQQAVQNGSIGGNFYANIGPSGAVDFITYNFNHTNECKRNMFRAPEFRRAISLMIDRDALVQSAVGGLGYPAIDYGGGEAAAPFDASTLEPFEFNPDQGLELLAAIGFTEEGPDGVLRDPETGCRASFTLQFNEGNDRRSQLAQVTAQTLTEYGVEVNARQVSTDIWSDSITGGFKNPDDPSKGLVVNYDAQIWGLAGGDVDNPSSVNVLGLGELLNSWNKSTEDVEPWEISMDRLSRRMDRTLDLDERVAVYNQRAELMREYLPMTPLIQQAFSFYENLGNTWPEEALDANSIEAPYTPGNYRPNVTVAEQE